jgi:GntR family transcriptional regulator/MocR family aminotransferase
MKNTLQSERFGGLGFLDVDVARRGTIRLQLLARIRTAIAEQRLPAGARLPSTRAVAQRLGISRSTVTEVFDQLLDEGALVARHGSGTYVSPVRREIAPRVRSSGATSWERVSRRGKLFADVTTRSRYVDKDPRAFQSGVPAVDLFPFATWSRLSARLLRNPPRELVSYGDPAGFLPLREAIAAELRQRRGVHCDAAQIIVTSGTQQSLDIVNRLVLDPDEEIWLEEPGSLAARSAFTSAGARIVPVPVDREGIDVAAGIKAAPRARLAFVTAANQWPTHVTLSPARRDALLAWAGAADAWIVEDDYDGVFRYDGDEPLPLRAASAERVLWIGSFSLTTFPALRIGYIVAPDALVDAFGAAKAATDRQGPTVEQAVLAEFLLGGHYVRHLRAMSAVYEERRDALARCLAEYLPSLRYASPSAGLHGVLGLRDRDDDAAIVRVAAQHGISVTPLSRHYVSRARRRGLLLGFGVPSPGEIRLGVRKLRDALAAPRS